MLGPVELDGVPPLSRCQSESSPETLAQSPQPDSKSVELIVPPGGGVLVGGAGVFVGVLVACGGGVLVGGTGVFVGTVPPEPEMMISSMAISPR